MVKEESKKDYKPLITIGQIILVVLVIIFLTGGFSNSTRIDELESTIDDLQYEIDSLQTPLGSSGLQTQVDKLQTKVDGICFDLSNTWNNLEAEKSLVRGYPSGVYIDRSGCK
jgi:uncharacterized protein YoxC